jgi:hypothetical protein
MLVISLLDLPASMYYVRTWTQWNWNS